jgi:hypothetical protein
MWFARLCKIDRKIIQLAIICAAAGVLVLPLLAPHNRIGDGSEYYAMYLAWKLNHRPAVTPTLRESYEALTKHGYVNGLWPFDGLLNAFPSLKIDDQRDYYHFSFYSLLAAIVGSALPDKLAADATNAFYLLHYLLILISLVVALYLFRLPGVVAVTVLLAASPALWYVNKVHTEFFTISLSITAVLLLLDRRFLWATLVFAIMSTQNPGFAFVGAMTGLAWVFDPHRHATKLDGIVAVATAVIVVFHPLYYWSRHGGFSPQVFGPDGTSGDPWAFLYMPIWLTDPDVGLLSYWPLGLLIVTGGLLAHRSLDFAGGRLAFCLNAFYLLFGLFAASQTSNLNSGGTVGVARYSTWFLCCFVPFMIVLARETSISSGVLKSSIYGLGALLAVYSVFRFLPETPEDYLHATPFSVFVQTYASRFYRPPTEIFVERYARLDQGATKAAVVVGPDCGRTAFLARSLHSGIVESRYCSIIFDAQKLLALMGSRLYGRDGNKWQYTRLLPADIETVRLRARASVYDSTEERSLRPFLQSGWSHMEPWGVWSDGKAATLAIPMVAEDFPSGSRITLFTGGFVPDQVIQMIRASINGRFVAEWRYDAQSRDQLHEIIVEPEDIANGQVMLYFDIPTAVSPKSLGFGDPRELGLAISRISISER